MPFKANVTRRRHHLPKQQHKVMKWAAYHVPAREPDDLIFLI
jgi:hypothetical protein